MLAHLIFGNSIAGDRVGRGWLSIGGHRAATSSPALAHSRPSSGAGFSSFGGSVNTCFALLLGDTSVNSDLQALSGLQGVCGWVPACLPGWRGHLPAPELLLDLCSAAVQRLRGRHSSGRLRSWSSWCCSTSCWQSVWMPLARWAGLLPLPGTDRPGALGPTPPKWAASAGGGSGQQPAPTRPHLGWCGAGQGAHHRHHEPAHRGGADAAARLPFR